MTEPVMTFVPSLDDVRKANSVVREVIRLTPMDSANFLGKKIDSPVLLKCENMQRTGSYKIRGATYRLSRLTPQQRERGVVAASAGNHAQGVALAAKQLGIRATIFMPHGVPIPKLEATRNYGAEVVLSGLNVGEALAHAQAHAQTTGATFIHPYDHPDVITGQGTLALDIFEQAPDVDTIVVPIGGGGLISGLAVTAKQLAAERGRTVRIIGVQAANSAPFPVSLAAGERVAVQATPTIADGIAVAVPGELTFPLVSEWVDEIVTVSETEIARAILLLVERGKLVAEPAGAVAVAAIQAGKIADSGTTVAVLSGGNIDPMMLEKVISQGLTASDRYLKLIINMQDVPGHLARISAILADINANVIEVFHTRHNKGVQITEVELEISVETRGPEHAREVLDALRRAGYVPRVDPNATI